MLVLILSFREERVQGNYQDRIKIKHELLNLSLSNRNSLIMLSKGFKLANYKRLLILVFIPEYFLLTTFDFEVLNADLGP